jgi:Zn-dependent alcohol dehydrogenase
MIANYIYLEDINKGFDDMRKGGVVKTVVLMK